MNFREFKQSKTFMGHGYRTTFENGYGASIIPEGFDEGIYDENELRELAVLKNDDLCYDTEITDDVLRRLTEEEVNEICVRIQSLDPAQ